MSISDSCHELQELFQVYEGKKAIGEQIATLRPRAEELKRVAGELTEVTARRSCYAVQDVEVPDEYCVDELLNQLRTVRERFDSDPTSLNQGRKLQRFQDSVQERIKTIETELDAAWRRYADGRLPAYNERIVRVLEGLDGCQEKAARLRGVAEKLEAYRVEPPTSGDVIDKFRQLTLEAKALHAELPLDELPQAAQQFLEKLAETDAFPLESMTDAIRAWLDENGLLGDFVITASHT